MKKVFILLVLFLIPIKVNAGVDYEKIHESISKTGEIIINSIPLEKFKETTNYKKCMSYDSFDGKEEQSKACLNGIYRLIVSADVKEKAQLEEGVHISVNSCDYETNICEVSTFNEVSGMNKNYKIVFEGDYDKNISEKANAFADNLKSSYYLSDMSYINQLINYVDEKGFFDTVIYDNSKVLSIFPEFKHNIEKNRTFDYKTVNLGVGGSPILYGSSSVAIIYYNNKIVGITDSLSYYTMQAVYIPDTTENTKEAYIEAAKERIEEYLNNKDYEISLEYDEEYNEMYCSDEWSICDVSRELNYIFEDEETYIASPYKLFINGNEYFAAIVPVPEEKIVNLEIKSIDYDTNISVETSGSNVPLDITLRIKDKSKEYGKHGYDRVYDINLYSLLKDGYVTKIYDGVKVMIPLSDNYKQKHLEIYHIKEDGTKGEKYHADVIEKEGKKYAVFTTNHFSMYGIESEKNPQTYAGIKENILLLFIGLIGFLATIKLNKKHVK